MLSQTVLEEEVHSSRQSAALSNTDVDVVTAQQMIKPVQERVCNDKFKPLQWCQQSVFKV